MSDLSLSVGRTGIKQDSLLSFLDTFAEMYHIGQTMPTFRPDLENTADMDLRTLLEVLFRDGGISSVKEFFSSHAFRISQPCKGTRFENTVVGVKYIDGLNQLWKPKWAREARGRFYYYDNETQSVLALKDTLQRGIEVLTHAHTSATITETQDMKVNSYSHLDTIQQECIQKFLTPEDTEINAYLTGKVDGSLILASIYPRGTPECTIMEEILAVHGDSFSKTLANECKGGPLVVIATQGTLFIGPDMQDYVVTSLQSLLGPLSDGITLEDAWTQQAPLFVKSVLEFVSATPFADQRMHLCFEAYCKGRKSLWGRLHTELAISYTSNGFNLLGSMVSNQYIPHFDLPSVVFTQPIHLHVTTTKQVYAIMRDMDRVVMGDLDRAEFLTRYGFPLTSTIHMEGWVLLTPISGCGYDYAKIKTPLYYKCHKIRSCEVPNLLALPTSCDATYPILTVLREFHTNADRQFSESIDQVVAMLETEISLGSESEFYKVLPIKARMHFVPERKDTLMRMLINVCGDLFRTRVVSILKNVWKIEDPHEDMVHLMKHILTKHTPWITPLSEDVRRDAMKQLYRILVESTVPQ
jgi:hypothetical protein